MILPGCLVFGSGHNTRRVSDHLLRAPRTTLRSRTASVLCSGPAGYFSEILWISSSGSLSSWPWSRVVFSSDTCGTGLRSSRASGSVHQHSSWGHVLSSAASCVLQKHSSFVRYSRSRLSRWIQCRISSIPCAYRSSWRVTIGGYCGVVSCWCELVGRSQRQLFHHDPKCLVQCGLTSARTGSMYKGGPGPGLVLWAPFAAELGRRSL